MKVRTKDENLKTKKTKQSFLELTLIVNVISNQIMSKISKFRIHPIVNHRFKPNHNLNKKLK